MPNCNQLLNLTEISVRRERETLNNVLAHWIKILLLAGSDGIWSYSQQVKEVTNKCRTLNGYLTSLPTCILDNLIPPLVADFLNKISSYHKTFRGLKVIFKHAETKHEAVCTEMLNCLLGPFTRRYNTGAMSSFEQRLIIQTFNSTPNLTNLVFVTAPEIDNSALMANNIHHLKHFESFQYNYRCTDEVIQQLALHCSKLWNIDVSNSRAVTDGSVQHLLKLKDLSDLDLTGTSVTDRKYRMLLSGLPTITNIKYSPPICESLNSM
jgi:hypothetical protein